MQLRHRPPSYVKKKIRVVSNVKHRSKSNFTSSINNVGYNVPNTMRWTASRVIAEQVKHVSCKCQLISRQEEEKRLRKIKGWVKFWQLVRKLKVYSTLLKKSSLKTEDRQVYLYTRRSALLISGLLPPKVNSCKKLLLEKLTVGQLIEQFPATHSARFMTDCSARTDRVVKLYFFFKHQF